MHHTEHFVTPGQAADATAAECIANSEHAQELRSAEKLHEARALFAACAAASCPGPIREDCARRLDEVVEATPTIVFEVKDAASNDVTAVWVTMDGQPVAVSAGSAIEVDPGEHTFAFAGRDRLVTEERRLVLAEGVKGRRETVVLRETAASPTPTPANGKPPRFNAPPLTWVAFGVGGASQALAACAAYAAATDAGAGVCVLSAEPMLQGICGSIAAFEDPAVVAAWLYWALLGTAGGDGARLDERGLPGGAGPLVGLTEVPALDRGRDIPVAPTHLPADNFRGSVLLSDLGTYRGDSPFRTVLRALAVLHELLR